MKFDNYKNLSKQDVAALVAACNADPSVEQVQTWKDSRETWAAQVTFKKSLTSLITKV